MAWCALFRIVWRGVRVRGVCGLRVVCVWYAWCARARWKVVYWSVPGLSTELPPQIGSCCSEEGDLVSSQWQPGK